MSRRYRLYALLALAAIVLITISTIKSVYIAIYAVSAFIFSAVGTWAAVLLLPRFGWWDNPNHRSNHAVPVPRGGGIAVIGAIVLFMLVSDAPGALVWGMVVLAAVSLLDDLRGVPARKRLAVQAIVCIACIVGAPFNILPALFGVENPAWWWVVIDKSWMVLLLLWFTNLYNFMDGIDGISGVETIGIGAGMAALAAAGVGPLPIDVPAYGMISAAAMAAFLLWNWHPAKIFLGDVGSIPLGFLLGVLLLWTASSGFWPAALILPAYYMTDATRTLATRLMRGANVLEAHSEHAYQQAARAGRSHALIARDILSLNMLLVVLAVVSGLMAGPVAWACVAIAYGLAFAQIRFYRGLYRGSAKADATSAHTTYSSPSDDAHMAS